MGQWQSDYTKKRPQQIPSPDREHLSTPTGLLFNELQKCPTPTLNALRDMLKLVLELDTGNYHAKSIPLLLYVFRTVVRVEGFVLYLTKHAQCKALAATGKNSTSGCGWESFVRGLDTSSTSISSLSAWQSIIHVMIEEQVLPMIQRWTKQAIKGNQLGAACILHAHMCYMYKNSSLNIATPATTRGGTRPLLKRTEIETLLVSQIFLGINFTFDAEFPNDKLGMGGAGTEKRSKAGAKSSTFGQEVNTALMIAQTEIFDLFTSYRWEILRWLGQNEKEGDEVMECIVKSLTETVDRNSNNDADDDQDGEGGGGKENVTKFKARRWRSMNAPGCIGRFVPDTEAVTQKKVAEKGMFQQWSDKISGGNSENSEQSFEAWLHETFTQVIARCLCVCNHFSWLRRVWKWR